MQTFKQNSGVLTGIYKAIAPRTKVKTAASKLLNPNWTAPPA